MHLYFPSINYRRTLSNFLSLKAKHVPYTSWQLICSCLLYLIKLIRRIFIPARVWLCRRRWNSSLGISNGTSLDAYLRTKSFEQSIWSFFYSYIFLFSFFYFCFLTSFIVSSHFTGRWIWSSWKSGNSSWS